MEALEAIFTRRSVRKFVPREIEPDKLETLLKAAMYAPSALNEQPWQFVLIDDKGMFEKIMHIYPYAGMLKSAPLAILVCGDTRLEKAPGNWVLDCSGATENILLAAHALGMGAVWSGIYPEEERIDALVQMLRLPPKVIPFALVAVGYPEGALPDAPQRYHPDRVHRNGW